MHTIVRNNEKERREDGKDGNKRAIILPFQVGGNTVFTVQMNAQKALVKVIFEAYCTFV